MNRRILAGVGAAAVVVASIAYFSLRSKPSHRAAAPAVASGSGSAGASAPRDKRGDGPDGPRGGDSDTILIDDDPVGALRLEGLVLDGSDQPVANATVMVSSNPRRTTTTDTDGGFAFDKLVGRSYTLVARAPSGIAGPLTAKLTAKSDPVVLHLRPGGSVAVTVVDKAAKPVPGATVELRGLDQQSTQADGEGHAHFETVVPGGYEVVAFAPGFAPSRQFTQVGAAAVELTLALVAGAAVSGVVLDDKRQPVAGARVIYSGASDWSVQADERLDGVVTDGAGKFAFAALPAGSFRFVARHEGFAPGTSKIYTLDGTNPTTDVEIAVTAGATVAGVVVDGNQAPIASARVRIGVASRNMIASEPRQVFTGEDGTFVVKGLPRKALEAVALAESGSSANVPVDLTAGDVKNVTLTIDQTGTIAGVVVDKNGEPLEGVQVSALPDFRAGSGGDPAQFRLRGLPQELTNAGGEFEIVGLAPGSYVVRASRSAGNRGRMFGTDGGQKAEAGTRNLRIVLPADGGVKGKVAFADGTTPTPFSVGVGFSNEPIASKDGKFELRDLPPQKYTLTVRGPDFDQKTVQVTVEEGQIADAGDIIVQKGRVIAGKVVRNGAPVVGATVYAGRQIFGTGTSNEASFGGPPGRGNNRTATTDEEGRFRITGLGPANLAVVAEHPDFGRSPALRVMRGAPDELALVLNLSGYGVLTGTVRDDSGPAENTIVTAQSVNTPNAMYSVASGDDGAFRFDKLAPDVYKVSAMLGSPMRGMSFYSKQVTVGGEGSPPATVDLAVEKGAVTLTLHISAKAGEMKGGFAWLISGSVAPKTIDDLNLITAKLPESQSTFGFLFGGRPVTYDNLRAGMFTACAALMPGEISDMQQGMTYFDRHGDDLPVTCKPVRVLDTPPQQSVDLVVPLPPFIAD